MTDQTIPQAHAVEGGTAGSEGQPAGADVERAGATVGVAGRPLWRDRAYLTWLVSDTTLLLGGVLQGFVLPLLVILLTGDPALAGIVAALGLGSQVVSALGGGVLADRHDLRRLMILGGVAGAAVSGAMAAAYAGGLGVGALAALNVLAGLRAGLLGGIASNAALKQVVPPARLPGAMSANQGRDAAVEMGGAPLGGLLLGLGPVVALAASAVVLALSTVSALLLRGDFRPERSPGSTSALAEVAEGVRWLWGRPLIRRILLVSLLLNLGFSAVLVTIVYDLGVRGEDPGRIGLVSTATGLGMLVGAVVAAPVVSRLPSGWVATAGLLLAGLAIAALPFSSDFWATLGILGVAMLGVPAVNAALMGYFMHIVPRRLVGRALSGAAVLTSGATPLAPVLAGVGLGTVGLRPTLLASAGLCLLSVLLVLGHRELRAIPRPDRWVTAEAG